MNNYYLLIVVLMLGLTGCMSNELPIEKKLAYFKDGDSVSTLENELLLKGKPSVFTPNLPIGEGHIIYFLKDGDLHVMTRVTDDQRVILSPAPFFIRNTASIKQRTEKSNQAWDEYVRTKMGKKN